MVAVLVHLSVRLTVFKPPIDTLSAEDFDMNTINSGSSSADRRTADLLQSRFGLGASETSTSRSNTGSSQLDAASATRVDLSDRAKAILARHAVDQRVADQLSETIAAMRDDGTLSEAAGRPANGRPAKIDDAQTLIENPTQSADAIRWVAGAPHGDPTKSDERFLKDGAIIESVTYTLENGNYPPGAAQALRDAYARGTIKIQNASEVSNLNFRSEHEFTPSRIGGGYDSWGSTSQTPTGATKDAIDQGRAVAMWTADRGDVYISW
ncbi:hypothetical protein [Bosea sp. 685]|uniref:hypothetical protein n=1 Tax=Bosea sp. 685 TaxID=3080057 RepID=UPI002892D8FF|nr:hypothetical protein [Bosea sp. 685]WNJ89791.1 hypothetical protein RMR04_25885 [Bosea sp. 685]